MITRPSINELITGLKRNLELANASGDPAGAASLVVPLLMGLDRIGDEWSSWWQLLQEENDDIATVLGSLGVAEQLVDRTEPETRNRALKSQLVDALEAFDLPADANADVHTRHAHEALFALILRMLRRESSIDVAPPRVAPTSGGATKDALPLDVLQETVTRFLNAELSDADAIWIEHLSRLPGGASREAWIFDLTIRQGHEIRVEPCILMREPVASVLVSDSSEHVIDGTRRTVANEIRVLAAMRKASLPVPEILFADTQGKWLERPFSIARRLPGTVDISQIAGTPAMQTLLDEYIHHLGSIHAIDPAAAGMNFLGTPSRSNAAMEQVDLMARNYERQAMEAFPAITWLIRWLRKNVPIATQVSVIHGDYRLGNFLQENGHIIAILDWEQAHLGDPLEEIAFMYWELWTLESVITIEDFVRRYELLSGRTIDRKTLAWYRLFIELKMLVVLLTGAHSYFATDPRQLQYSGGQTNQMVRESELRALLELARGEPTVAFDAWKVDGTV